MKYNKIILLLIVGLLFFACTTNNEDIVPMESIAASIYFPANDTEQWSTFTAAELDWNTSKLTALYSFLEVNNTRAFIILKDGKIVVEQYWGQELIGGGEFTAESNWYWASAGKSLTATLVGLAQQEGLLKIEDQTASYLGSAWTSLSSTQETSISIENQLSMTTGLDYTVDNPDCTSPECLLYKQDAGSQWYYHNAPYTLLEDVVSKAANTDYNKYTATSLADKIGMKGLWIKGTFNNVYYSNARTAARFGLFMLAKGKWHEEQILADSVYYAQMINSSQDLNPAYGYLWWLNGKQSFRLPGSTFDFNGSLAPNAPSDLFAAMGKNGQFINVVPSEGLVVVRMGEAPDNSLVPVLFHDEMWGLLSELFRNER